MVEWIAIVAFCMGEQCGFWTNTDRPFLTEAECRKNLAEAQQYFKQNGAQGVLSGCVPLKWMKV